MRRGQYIFMPKIHTEQIGGAPLFFGGVPKNTTRILNWPNPFPGCISVRRSITTKQKVTKSCPN